jgi:hypothetical protein
MAFSIGGELHANDPKRTKEKPAQRLADDLQIIARGAGFAVVGRNGWGRAVDLSTTTQEQAEEVVRLIAQDADFEDILTAAGH